MSFITVEEHEAVFTMDKEYRLDWSRLREEDRELKAKRLNLAFDEALEREPNLLEENDAVSIMGWLDMIQQHQMPILLEEVQLEDFLTPRYKGFTGETCDYWLSCGMVGEQYVSGRCGVTKAFFRVLEKHCIYMPYPEKIYITLTKVKDENYFRLGYKYQSIIGGRYLADISEEQAMKFLRDNNCIEEAS